MAIHPLKRLRLDQGLSVREISEAVGVAASTFSNWETGQSRPQPRHVEPLARALHLTPKKVNDFFYTDAEPSAA